MLYLLYLIITPITLGILLKITENDKIVNKLTIITLSWIVIYIIMLFIQFSHPLIFIIDIIIKSVVSIIPIILVIKNRKNYSGKRQIFLIIISILHILCVGFYMKFEISAIVNSFYTTITGIQIV